MLPLNSPTALTQCYCLNIKLKLITKRLIFVVTQINDCIDLYSFTEYKNVYYLDVVLVQHSVTIT